MLCIPVSAADAAAVSPKGSFRANSSGFTRYLFHVIVLLKPFFN